MKNKICLGTSEIDMVKFAGKSTKLTKYNYKIKNKVSRQKIYVQIITKYIIVFKAQIHRSNATADHTRFSFVYEKINR